ncbi:hypothetical protein E3N88_04014 [Mikania micrantha]|uniref:DNA-directed RNA polymerase n=1 Tax=Mikania micrantha TaxID=192012 RepID=A0A5N6PV42_9ASTR|nr:hypothetical protein E3N88_04014 [Mikania micrantha]
MDYPWKPLKCFNCKELGHSTVKCPNHSQTLTQPLKKKKERKRSLKRLIILMTGKLCRDLQVHLRSIFAFQYFSIGASLIPFIEHNDANRALMSSNMQRQAVPLSQSEKCIVGTGLEGQAALDSGALAIAEHEGKIFYTDTDKILLSGNGDTLFMIQYFYIIGSSYFY